MSVCLLPIGNLLSAPLPIVNLLFVLFTFLSYFLSSSHCYPSVCNLLCIILLSVLLHFYPTVRTLPMEQYWYCSYYLFPGKLLSVLFLCIVILHCSYATSQYPSVCPLPLHSYSALFLLSTSQYATVCPLPPHSYSALFLLATSQYATVCPLPLHSYAALFLLSTSWFCLSSSSKLLFCTVHSVYFPVCYFLSSSSA